MLTFTATREGGEAAEGGEEGGGSLLLFDSHKSVCVRVWKMPLGNCLRVGKLGKWMRPQLSKEFGKQQCALATEWSSPRSRCGLVTYINIYKKGRHGRTHNSSCVCVLVCVCLLVCVQTFVNCAPFDPDRRGERKRASQEVVSGVVIIVVARVPLCYQLAAIDAVKRQPIAE